MLVVAQLDGQAIRHCAKIYTFAALGSAQEAVSGQ
jgi:hypothetical protein